MLCFRLLNDEDKSAPLEVAVDALRMGQDAGSVFDVNPASFRQVPNAPFAYWVSEQIRLLFSQHPSLESKGRSARRGPSSGDDFRRVRCWWEISSKNISAENGWVPFSKGGSYSPFYADVHLLVSWESARNTFHGFLGRPGRMIEKLESVDCFFRPGLSWPLRTQSGLALRAMPAGCAFGHKGPAAFATSNMSEDLAHLLAITTSAPFRGLVEIQMAFGSYEVGVLQRTVLPDKYHPQLTALARAGWLLKRRADTQNLTSHAFFAPALARARGSLLDGLVAWAESLAQGVSRLAEIRQEIDAIAYRLYGIGEEDRRAIEHMLSKGQSAEATTSDEDDTDAEDVEDPAGNADALLLVAELLDYAVGCAFGRWDVRYATGATPAPAEPDPFAALPICAPGMLQSAAGLPASPADVLADYPSRITWPGILVDDERKPDDVVRRVHEVLEVIFPGRADTITDEACAILGAKSLRDWFNSPSGFFAGHLKRHSKSRRQAPIYWPLSSPKGLYTVWLYLHRLTTDTFFTVLRDHVKPRLEDEERHVFNLKQQAGPSATPSQARDIAAAEELVEDLRALRDELQHIAPLWRPDLNDGVIINHAPLWRMANHAPWRKALKETWESLVAGKYDWAHLALHLWPERVIPKCATDRSLAIAHGVESFFWGTDPKTGEVAVIHRTEAEVKALITERTSPAVKAALDSLLTAAAPTGGTTKRGRKKAS